MEQKFTKRKEVGMVSNKLFKTFTIILHFCSMVLGIVALAFVATAFSKADLNMIASYLARETEGDMSQTATRVQFLEALKLTGVYSSMVKACCFGLGAILASFAGNIMGVIGNVDHKGNR